MKKNFSQIKRNIDYDNYQTRQSFIRTGGRHSLNICFPIIPTHLSIASNIRNHWLRLGLFRIRFLQINIKLMVLLITKMHEK